ncbi:unnamed protein product [Prunus armeniaca]|uniref:Uncharacterized protein n=1 Tax=Prunus armeniaca TaxID=36596 RepID=A0A6J5TST9_PRUAR|nr:unnamed protein product [Prunus armeniaca]CAB4297554.1 unnamed protein product [Prunus armeniaca]
MGFKREAEPRLKEAGNEGKHTKVMNGGNEAEKEHKKGSRQRRSFKSPRAHKNSEIKGKSPKILDFSEEGLIDVQVDLALEGVLGDDQQKRSKESVTKVSGNGGGGCLTATRSP